MPRKKNPVTDMPVMEVTPTAHPGVFTPDQTPDDTVIQLDEYRDGNKPVRAIQKDFTEIDSILSDVVSFI